MPDPVIEASDLSRSFGPIRAVDRLTLRIGRGEVFGLLGHNGAGKTTTIRLLNGVLPIESGSATVLGLDPARDGAKLRTKTGVLTETPAMDERLSAADNLRLMARLFGIAPGSTEVRVTASLTRFGLGRRADTLVAEYSKGMKQRLALARVLLHDPELLFLDEPTAGLDPVASREVHDLIDELARERGRTVVICSHNLTEVQKLCDRVAVLRSGRLVAQGTARQLAEEAGTDRLLEIRTSLDTRDEAMAIIGQAGLVPIPVDDDGLTVAGVGRLAIPDLVRALASGHVELFSVHQPQPTLEDVYFSLLGEVVPE